MDGMELLKSIPDNAISCCFADFQYRGIMDKMNYGNEGARQKGRALLRQMSENTIVKFIDGIVNVLGPSGYLFLWVDKFHLCSGSHLDWFHKYQENYDDGVVRPIMNLVDLINWNKKSFSMGYRSRGTTEYLLVYQKSPKTTKTWKNKSIRDTWDEKIEHPRSGHPHRKPFGLISTLINSVTEPNELVLDPCAGSFVVMDATNANARRFIGCDIEPDFCE
jgi:site-specific DNA-methyltransferase (adenine-specific)